MKEIIIRCPVTQIPIRTGQLTTPTSFRGMKVTGTLESCPACGRPHQWDSGDAWIIDAEVGSLDKTGFKADWPSN